MSEGMHVHAFMYVFCYAFLSYMRIHMYVNRNSSRYEEVKTCKCQWFIIFSEFSVLSIQFHNKH